MAWDYVIIGSGFGGSVSALRLAEKGYRVLVLEKGKRFAKEDFPKNNRDLKRWMWNPALGLHGIFQMTFLRHVTGVNPSLTITALAERAMTFIPPKVTATGR